MRLVVVDNFLFNIRILKEKNKFKTIKKTRKLMKKNMF